METPYRTKHEQRVKAHCGAAKSTAVLLDDFLDDEEG